jgi:DNA-directed RNA polymerase specialized sigma24 family protein
MGVSNHDKAAGHRRLEQQYEITTKEGVKEFLDDYLAIRERMYLKGDYAAVDMLADLETAIKKAKLTDKQKQALYMRYVLDGTKTDEELAQEIGLSQDGLWHRIDRACAKIAKVFEEWGYREIITEGETK